MFSRSSGQFDRLIDAGMTPDQVHIFRSILCNPDMELEHDGIVTFNGPVVSPTVQAGRWAVAQHNWNYNPDKSYPFTYPSNGGGMALVTCKEADDYKGNGTTGKSDITIYLPVTPGDDPNVVRNDVIPFFEMGDGVFMAPGFGDDRVGTIRQDINGDSGISGWGVMNGTANAKANGGTALDIATSGNFLRQWPAVGNNKATGGAATDSVTVAAHAGSAVDSSVTVATHSAGNTGNTTIDEEVEHLHILDNSSIVTSAASGTPMNFVSGNLTGLPQDDLAHSAHNHTTPALSHSVTGSSALSHSAVSVDTIPPFMYAGFLERLNNSRTGLGL